ncbi:hypothetical protein G3O08_19750 [Cryomorpha ignava]|uniref:Uncharacterized protein n=1 Tax=Cryomorpha ignava TaxID=101383 RepID=A0A7K3WW05_9FLAO|nr:hypothetical protein [Cryomorpha ignava]NEN25728.1 hypothetical protein [Cryomorpha ignava]
MKDAAICMTATITPNTVLVSATDVSERLADYKKCIRFYLDQTNLPIYFLENSDYDLSKDVDFEVFKAVERFKLIRFKPHPDSEKGKGFQEFYTLDRFVKNHLKESVLIKVTGRYIVKNVEVLIAQIQSQLTIDLHRKMKVAITGFFVVDKAIYLAHFYEKYKLANDKNGKFIEHVLYDEIMSSSLKSITTLLPQNSQYRGVSGSYGGSLERNKYKMMVRQMERKILRSLDIPQFLIEY